MRLTMKTMRAAFRNDDGEEGQARKRMARLGSCSLYPRPARTGKKLPTLIPTSVREEGRLILIATFSIVLIVFFDGTTQALPYSEGSGRQQSSLVLS